MHDRLRQQWRDRIGRNPESTEAIIDAQGTRNTAQGGMRGLDAGKKVEGRKPHLAVDTPGRLLAVIVASVQDRDAAAPVAARACDEATGHAHRIGVEIVRRPGNRSTGPWGRTRGNPRGLAVASGFVVQTRRRAGESARMPGTDAHDA